MPEITLSRRLYAAFLLVRDGVTVADIGTDHAYLPIALVSSGKSPSAIACDINPMPLASAQKNIDSWSLSHKITTHLANGAEGLEGKAQEFVVAGMGGELICQIIKAADFLKDESLHLVLQPMTKSDALRSFIWNEGFFIDEEKYLVEDGHFYVILSVGYSGIRKSFSPIEALIGEKKYREGISKEEKDALIFDLENKCSDYYKKINGKRIAHIDTSADEEIYSALNDVLKEMKGV